LDVWLLWQSNAPAVLVCSDRSGQFRVGMVPSLEPRQVQYSPVGVRHNIRGTVSKRRVSRYPLHRHEALECRAKEYGGRRARRPIQGDFNAVQQLNCPQVREEQTRVLVMSSRRGVASLEDPNTLIDDRLQ